MRIVFASVAIASLLFSACGKKAEPAPPAPAETATAEPKPEPKPEPTPEPDTVPAPVEVDTMPAPVEAMVQPAFWALLFEKDKVTSWDVAEEVSKTETKEDGTPGETKVENLTGKLTCTVKDVQTAQVAPAEGAAPVATVTSTVECEGYTFNNGVAEGPAGTWVTDGKTLWKKIGDVQEVRFVVEPVAKSDKTEESEISFTAIPETEGLWCWKHAFLIGDGGVLEACFDKAKGPVKFFGHGGSAATNVKITVTPVVEPAPADGAVPAPVDGAAPAPAPTEGAPAPAPTPAP